MSDIDQIKDILLANVNLPNSLFIVGMGNEDFENMMVLDQLYKNEPENCPR